jgi:SOUL heme-binding protein
MTKSMYIGLIVLGSALLLWFLYSWLSVRSIEEPKYIVVSEAVGYEIREYTGYIIAETTVTGVSTRAEAASKGFPIVARYIFGDNTSKSKLAMTVPVNTEDLSSEKLAMTAPVNTEREQDSDSYKISFVMPGEYTLATLPEPNDSKVRLVEVPPRKVAVRRFSWSNSETNFKEQEIELISALVRDGVETVGVINLARYNPPWTIPFMLRSEVQIAIK